MFDLSRDDRQQPPSQPVGREELVFTRPTAYREVAANLQHVEAAQLLSRYSFRGGDVIVDLGCGDGSFSVERLLLPAGPNGLLIGVDRSPEMLNSLRTLAGGRADRVPGLHAIQADLGLAEGTWTSDIRKLVAGRGGIDLIFSNATLHHLYTREEQLNALGHCRNLLDDAHRLAKLLFAFAGRGNYAELIESAEAARRQLSLNQYFRGWTGYPLLRPSADEYREILREAGMASPPWEVQIHPTEHVTLYDDPQAITTFCKLCLRSYMNQVRQEGRRRGESDAQVDGLIHLFATQITENYLALVEKRPDGKVPLVSRNLEVVIGYRGKSARVAQFTAGSQQIPEHEAALVRFLDTVSELPEVRAYRPIVDELLKLEPTNSVLDAGAGVGGDALRIARLLGPDGAVTALDRNPYRIEVLRQRAAQAGLATIEGVVGDLQDLSQFSDRFDRVYVERTLIHVADPKAALLELYRALKPGGRIVVVEPNFHSLTFASSDPSCTQAIVRARAAEIKNPSMGVDLPQFLATTGFNELSTQRVVLPHSYEASSLLDLSDIASAAATGDKRYPPAEQLNYWLVEQRERSERGEFRSSTDMYVVSALKPVSTTKVP